MQFVTRLDDKLTWKLRQPSSSASFWQSWWATSRVERFALAIAPIRN